LPRTDDERVRARIRPHRVQRPAGGDADPAPLSGRVAPVARVLAHLASAFVDDRARIRLEPVPGQEVAIVRAAEEARLLALTPRSDGQARALRLVSRLRLRLLPQRKPDAREARGVEPREH